MKFRFFYFLLICLLYACSGTNHKSDAYGSFEATEVIIAAQANGEILWLLIEEGDLIETGDTIGLIDTITPSLMKLQLIAQRNAVASGIQNILSQIKIQEQKKANLLIDKNRIEKLLEDGAATQKQLDDINGAILLVDKQIASVKTQNSSVFGQVEAYNYQIAQMNESIRKCHIISPLNGTVLVKYTEAREIAAMGKPLLKIADLNEMILRAFVSGAQLPAIEIGQVIEVLIDKDEKSNQNMNGTIIWISENAEFTPKIIQTKEERVKLVYAVKVKVKNDGTLKIGMPGEINFTKSDLNNKR